VFDQRWLSLSARYCRYTLPSFKSAEETEESAIYLNKDGYYLGLLQN